MESAAIDAPVMILRDLFSGRGLDNQLWEPFREGIDVRWIYKVPAGCAAALLRYRPGASLARHVHAGFEHILVLRGSQIDENGEHGAGTLLIHSPGTTHAITSPRGCIVLAVWEKPVHMWEDAERVAGPGL
jgi:anti-sigma factor ChrR (cupin superfamily)